MADTNTARSKHYLEKLGWKCWTVEQMVRIPAQFGHPPKMFKRDAWNFGDLLAYNTLTGAITPEEWLIKNRRNAFEFGQKEVYELLTQYTLIKRGIALIQTTTTPNQAARISKIKAIAEAIEWLKSGGKIFVHGWSKKGPRGGRKTWQCTVTELKLDSDGWGIEEHREQVLPLFGNGETECEEIA